MIFKNPIIKETLFQTIEFYIGWITAHIYFGFIKTFIKKNKQEHNDKFEKHEKLIKHILLITSFFFIFVLIQINLNKYLFTSKYNSVGFVIGYTFYLQTNAPELFDYYK